MMHGREKSDSAVVATKPADKTGRLVAEWVEHGGHADFRHVSSRAYGGQ